MTESEHADYVIASLTAIGVLPEKQFKPFLLGEYRRVGSQAYEDLGAMVITESIERMASGDGLKPATLTRIVDTLRHRIVREAKRIVHSHEAVSDGSEISESDLMTTIGAFIDSLDPVAAMLFTSHYIDGVPVADLVDSTGMRKTTIYESLKESREQLRSQL